MIKTRALVTLVVMSPMLAAIPQPAAFGSATATVRPVRPPQAPDVISEIRAVPTRQHGVSRPTSLAWDSTSRNLVVGATGKVLRLSLDGTYVRHTHVAGTPVAGSLAVNPTSGAASYVVRARGVDYLRSYSARALRRHYVGTRGTTLRLPHSDLSGVAFDRGGALVALDGSTLVRRGRDGRPVRTVVRGVTGHQLRGLTTWPGSTLLFTADLSTDTLLGVDGRGYVARRYDLGGLDVRSLKDLVIAPSADQTDDASVNSLYVLDAGGGATGARVLEASFTTAAVTATAAAVTATVVRSVATSSYSPPSPDPSGIAYLPNLDRMIIGDGEVDEMSIFRGVNLFETTRTGAQTRNGVSQPWSNEPTGVGYIPANQHLLVSDDDKKEVFDVAAGPDGRYGSSDDTVTSFDTAVAGNNDTEDVTYDPPTGSIWTIDGVNKEVYRYRPGGDGRFGTSDDVRSSFDVGVYGALDPEGIAYDSARDTLVVIDDKSDRIYELDRAGSLLNTISTSAANMVAAAGVAVAPSSTGSSARNYYAVARGIDNNSNSSENDGMLYEFSATLPPTGGGGSNQAPVVSAGTDQTITLPSTASLDGTVSDDGQPSPSTLTTTWSKVSGVGTVTFGNPSSVDTTAAFSAAGTYVLRLTVSDGQATGADEVTVVVNNTGSPGAVVVETSVTAGSDDAEQSSSGSVSLTSSDLELVTDGTTVQTVGVRFASLQVPPGASVSRAWVQFQADEVGADSTSLALRAEAADSAPTYQATSGNITSRAVTAASVPWTPPAWNVVGEAASAQRTPDISALVQAVVGRAGWAQGNALAVQISGSGRRTAEAFEGTSSVPVLHVEYGGGTAPPPVNQVPVVNAGADQSVLLPMQATLDGTVSDDGLPSSGSLTTTWTKVSGPGTVTFGNAAAVDTTATFGSAGTFVLRLTANDSALSASDDITVTAHPVGTVIVVDVPLRAGADDAEQRANGSVQLSSSDLDLTLDGRHTISAVGLRFTGLDLPVGAVVTRAYVQFTADESGSGTSSLRLRAQAADSAPAFTASSGNLTSRALSSAAADWAPSPWTAGAAGTAQRTSDLSAVLQEILGRAGWARGNAVALLVTGTGQRTAESFEGNRPPVLHIEWRL